MCPFVANQHHSCRAIQVPERLRTRKTESVIWGRYLQGRLSGSTVRVEEVAAECESRHCVIHRKNAG